MKFKETLAVGKQLKLDFSQVSKEVFEVKRLAYHQALQEEFFRIYRVESTEKRTIRAGESIWLLAQKTYHAPMWLIRQHNPAVNFRRVNAGVELTFPKVIKK